MSLWDRCCRGGDYSQVHGTGDVANALVGFECQHFFMLRVDGIHGALKAVQQVLQNGSAYGAGTIGRADDRHRTGSEHCVQAVLFWCCPFLFIRCLFHEISLS